MRTLAASFLIALLSTAAHAQQTAENYGITLSVADWNIILSALGERPAKDVFGTIVKVQQQIGEAQKAKTPPPVPLPPPKPAE